MKKTALVLLGDYWHRRPSIEPMLPKLLPSEKWEYTVEEDPKALLNCAKTPDLLISFKDVIENDQIPTPIWCDEEWTAALDRDIREGMGFLAIHCGIADIPREHFITQKILKAFFITHPRPCPVTFVPAAEHPITAGVEEFSFDFDEHYQMEMIPGTETAVLGYTDSVNGRQVGLWAHDYGKGRVCASTPGHAEAQLSKPEYLKLLINAAEWCVRQ